MSRWAPWINFAQVSAQSFRTTDRFASDIGHSAPVTGTALGAPAAAQTARLGGNDHFVRPYPCRHPPVATHVIELIFDRAATSHSSRWAADWPGGSRRDLQARGTARRRGQPQVPRQMRDALRPTGPDMWQGPPNISSATIVVSARVRPAVHDLEDGLDWVCPATTNRSISRTSISAPAAATVLSEIKQRLPYSRFAPSRRDAKFTVSPITV